MTHNKKFHEIKSEILTVKAKNGKIVIEAKKQNSEKPKFTLKEPEGDWSKRYNVDPAVWLTDKYPNPRLAGALYNFPTRRTSYGDIIDGQLGKMKKIYDQATKMVLCIGITTISFFTLAGMYYVIPVIFAGLVGYYYKKTTNEKYTYEHIDKNFLAIASITKDATYPPHISGRDPPY